jgi:activator of HSP90 ATPase
MVYLRSRTSGCQVAIADPVQNKNCGPWAHEWVKKTLPGVKVEQGAEKAEIVEVTTVTGDCDLGQRKGK